MKPKSLLLVTFSLLAASLVQSQPGNFRATWQDLGLNPDAAANTLPATEAAFGWKLLFNGNDF